MPLPCRAAAWLAQAACPCHAAWFHGYRNWLSVPCVVIAWMAPVAVRSMRCHCMDGTGGCPFHALSLHGWHRWLSVSCVVI
eukprot:353345-Chlamydomonas_euryale.AAC.2